MKILWICNIMLPKIAENLKLFAPVGGGWLSGLSDDLLKQEDISLIVCFPYKEKISGSACDMQYYSFIEKNAFDTISDIIEKEKPDIVHIFGTEYKHTLDAVDACVKTKVIKNTIINIQGLVSVYAKHYAAFLPYSVQKKYSFRDFVKQANVVKGMKKFQKRGIYEIEALKKVEHVIGRTDWDFACTTQINPNLNYHFCNETLRTTFYKNKWSIDSCKRHSIFVSQCHYPIKGFHLMLEAMLQIIKLYPDAILYTTGRRLISKADIKSKLKATYYEIYINKLIKKYKLENNVVFLGALNESDMCQAYLNAHTFVSASSIENSPNSVGEAMILGVPCVSSDVGGVKNMMAHTVDGYIYPADEPYMLAHYVCEIFKNDELASEFSINARSHALKTHDREVNLKTMLEIYNEIGGCK